MGSDKFKIPDEWYSVSDIQEYFGYNIKKHETVYQYKYINISIDWK